jgi:hypothetical protein
MGLFGSTKTIITVASTVYNMSGDYNADDKYFKAIVISGILQNISVADTIIGNLYNCPKSRFTKFFNYALNNNYKGNLITKINNRKKVDIDVIIDYLNPDLGTYVVIEKAFIDYGDITYWANKHILLNYPNLVLTDWVAELAPLNQILITYEDTSTELINLPTNYLYSNEYLIAYVKYYNESYNEPEEEGAIIEVDFEDLPDTSDYTTIDNDITNNSESLTETTTVLREYSNTTPSSTTTSSTSSTEVFTSHIKTKEKTTYLGIISGEIRHNLKETYIEYLNYNIIESTDVDIEVINHGSYTETITTTVVTEIFEPVYTYQINSQITVLSELINEDMLIYKLGSGITILDALQSTSTDITEDLYPIIPLRIYNTSVKDIPDWYNEAKQAYSVVMDKNFDKLLDNIEDNSSIGDIDYAYIHFGFPLNTESKDEKLYIYEFFKNLINYQESTREEYLDWLNEIYANKVFIDDYVEWFTAQSNPSDPLFGSSPPLLNGTLGSKVVKPSESVLEFRTNNLDIEDITTDNFDIRISWSNIQEDIYTGLGKIGATKGDIWFSTTPPPENIDFTTLHASSVETFTEIVRLGLFIYDPVNMLKDGHIYLYHQIENFSYKVLSIAGLAHRNYIYRSYYNVGITGKEAIEDTEPSGFIIPLSKYVLNQVSWVVGNEICIRAGNLIFNSWQSRKTRWYPGSVFKVLVIVISIIIAVIVTIVTGGAGSGPVGGLSASIVAALGVAGTTALILTAILTVAINMVIGMIISAILTRIFTPIIGARYAKLVSAVATMIIMGGINTGFDATAMEGLLLRADSLILLGLSVTNTVIEEVDNVQELSSEVKALEDRNKKQEKLIRENNELLGIDRADDLINKVLEQLTLEETPGEFLSRTLMRSDDIIRLSMDAINRFTEIVL